MKKNGFTKLAIVGVLAAAILGLVACNDSSASQDLPDELSSLQVETKFNAEEVSSQESPELFAATARMAIEQSTEMMEELSISGLTIAMVDIENDFTWLQSFGYADVANQVPVTENTIFPIASVSKTFTAVSIMQLVEMGLLDLDEPIVTYLPEFSMLPHPVYGGNYRNITARMLLSHVSGVHEFFGEGFIVIDEGQDREFMNRQLPALANLHMQNEEVNRITYSNTAYTLLGILVARLTESENYFDGFVEFTQENIFTPAGMSNSSFEINEYNRPYIALPHHNAETPVGFFSYTSPTSSGGMVSTAYDMARFMNIMLNGGAYNGNDANRILLPKSVDAMATVQDWDIAFPANPQYGLGLLHDTLLDGSVMVGHGGAIINGWFTFMILDFDNGLGVFVSSNSGTAMGAHRQIAQAIWQSAVLEKNGEAYSAVPADEYIDNAKATYVIEPTPIYLSAEELEQFLGFYAQLGELRLSEDGIMYFPHFPGLPMPLEFVPMSDGTFETMIGRLAFEEINGIMLIMLYETATILTERVDNTPASPGFVRWVGMYEWESGGSSETRIGINCDGFVYLEAGGFPTVLSQIDENTVFVAGRRPGQGCVFRFSMEGDTVVMTRSGLRAIRINEAYTDGKVE